jgi:hypothetical protein
MQLTLARWAAGLALLTVLAAGCGATSTRHAAVTGHVSVSPVPTVTHMATPVTATHMATPVTATHMATPVKARRPTTPAARHHRHHHHRPTAPTVTTPSAPPAPPPSMNPIPQDNGGDHDADNNGGPIDGDGNI